MVNSIRLLSIIGILFLTGCAVTPAKKEVIQKEDVIVYEIPMPPTVVRPVLQTTIVTAKNTLGDKTKAMEVTIKQLQNYATDLELIVNKYKALANTSTNIMNVATPGDTGIMVDVDLLKAWLKEHATQTSPDAPVIPKQ